MKEVENIIANSISMLNNQGMNNTVETIINEKPFITMVSDEQGKKVYIDFMNPLVTDKQTFYQMSQQVYQEFNSYPVWYQGGLF